MMGSLKALQEWCRIQCEDYKDVEINNMSTSFRDGLAFCAIIHRYRPDLIDFSSLSKENIYENNNLAFEVAETQLGIPALLDPEDMVSMNVPDRLSVITYVSQYYNFFTNKSHANPPCMKRPGGKAPSEPAQKRPVFPQEDKVAEPGTCTETAVRRGTLSSTCAACQKHVHLVQRFLVDGRLYHRNCFRCRECSSTLLPGSYKLGKDSGSLVCTHHFTRPALANQNGWPDLSDRPSGVQSVRIGRNTPQQSPPSEREEAKTPPPSDIKVDPSTPAYENDSLTAKTDPLEQENENMDSGDTQEEPRPSSPDNPFDESDAEEEEAPQAAAEETTNGTLPITPVSHAVGIPFPVPAPRRIPERAPPPRPAPRVRSRRRAPDSAATKAGGVNGEHRKPVLPPKPRERSQSPGSLSSGTPKPKDPPWLALVQSEPRKKPPPPPPPLGGQATPPHAGSLSSLKEEASTLGTPPPPTNPFEEEDEEVEGEGGEDEGGTAAPPVGAGSHPWYRITQAAEGAGSGPDAPPSGGSSPRSASPKAPKGKKRPAPRAPQPPSSSSQALSMDSLSSGSDHSTSQTPLGGSDSLHEPAFSKSVSEPSISTPGDGPSAPSPCSSSSAERLSHLSLNPSPAPVPPNASSAPATPQSNRSAWTKGPRPPPPRPPATPSPLASETPSASSKRTCKENPFNRKASPSHTTSTTRPPRGPRPARSPAPGHGFPLIKRKVQSDQYIPVEDIHVEMSQLEHQLDELEQRGVELERKLRDSPNDEEEEHLLVDWFTLIHEKHLLVRREAELVYTAKQQNLEERQADVEYELRCLLNKPEKEWNDEDKGREQELMANLVTIIEQRNHIINSMDLDRQRDEEEDRLMAAMLKKKDFNKEPASEQQQKQQKKKGSKFKPMKALKRLSHKGEPGKGQSPHKES